MSAIPSSSHIHGGYNAPVAVKSGSVTYFAVTTDGLVPAVGRYDHTKRIYEVGHPRGSSYAALGGTSQDHNSPAVLVLANGKILCCYGYYQGAAYASISTNAGDVMGGWTETQVYDGSSNLNAYAQLCQTTDSQATIWWFFRNGSSGTRQIAFRINQGGGAGGSWTAQGSTIKLIASTSQRPYFRIARSGNRIDLLYTDGHPAEVSTNSLYHLYLTISSDGTQFSAFKSDGTLIDTWAITGGTGTVNSTTFPLAVTAGTKIYDGTTNKCSLIDLRHVAGTLTAIYPVYSTTTQTDDTHKYRRATYDGSAWTHEDICYAGDSTSPGTAGRVPQWLYPDASTTEPEFSPGACLDPNTADRVYVGKKYADGDVRIQQWDKSGGTWSKTSDLTGASGNGKVNARPVPISGASPTNILWFTASTYTSLSSFTTVTPGMITAPTLYRSSKPTSPIWTPAYKYPGLKALYLLAEGTGGSGATIADLTGSYNGVIAGGSPTWLSDATYGPGLSGFTTAISVTADSLASSGLFDNTGTFPKWIAVLCRNLNAGTSQYVASFGSSTVNNSIFGSILNPSTDNQVGGIYRDAAGAVNTFTVAKTRDTGFHTMFFIAESLSAVSLYVDGQFMGRLTTTTSTVAFDRFTIGALRRSTQANPFLGEIYAVGVGQGAAPSPVHVHTDLINGQFLGSWAVPAPAVSLAGSMLCGL